MATNSPQDSGIGAAPAADQDAAKPYSLWLIKRLIKSKRKKTLGEFPVAPVFYAFAIGAPIMLVGLPLGALTIVHLSGCCTNQSIGDLISFWGSVFGGMLALFGTLITAVFVISAFRIDKSAKAEAAAAAAESVGEFIVKNETQLLRRIDEWLGSVESRAADIVAKMETARSKAVERIDAEMATVEDASREAVARMSEVRDNVAQRGRQTADVMDEAASDVADAKAAAVDRIGMEVAEVERVAEEAKAKIDAQSEPPTSGSQG